MIDEGIQLDTPVERGDVLVTAGFRGSRYPPGIPVGTVESVGPHRRPHRADPGGRALGEPRGRAVRGRPPLRRGLPVSAPPRREADRDRRGRGPGRPGGPGRDGPAGVPGVAGRASSARGATSSCSSPSPPPWRPTPSGGPSPGSASVWPSTCSSTPPWASRALTLALVGYAVGSAKDLVLRSSRIINLALVAVASAAGTLLYAGPGRGARGDRRLGGPPRYRRGHRCGQRPAEHTHAMGVAMGLRPRRLHPPPRPARVPMIPPPRP